MGFVFYDTETTGCSSAFDQVLHFAAIKTDHNLNVVERFEVRSRLLPHVIPSPEAIKINGVGVEQLTDPALPSHYEMVASIREKLEEWSPSIIVGHNSIAFDEHFLRQALYQTLHYPYLTNTNGNCRLDSMRLAQATSLYAPEALKVPMTGEKKSFGLSALAIENGFKPPREHSAIFDAETTMQLCKLLNDEAPEVWSTLVRFAQRNSIIDFVNDEAMFSLSEYSYGKPYSWIVSVVGTNPENRNEIIVFDLVHDPAELEVLDDSALRLRLGTYPKPVRSFRANGCPIIFPEYEAPDIAMAKKISFSELERRALKIEENQVFSKRLLSAYLDGVQEKKQSSHVEEQIYDRFTNNQDQALSENFHKHSWSDRLSLVTSISDDRLQTLGERLIYIERPNELSSDSRRKHEIATAKRVLGEGDSPWMTLPNAIQEAQDLIEKTNGKGRALLTELQNYLISREQEAINVLSEL